MVEYRDGRQDARGSKNRTDDGLAGQIFGDSKKDRDRDRDNRPGSDQPRVQPQPGGKRDQFDFNPPGTARPRGEHPNNPNTPRDQNPPRTTPRDQFPNFPNVQPKPKDNVAPPQNNPRDRHPNNPGVQPRPGDNNPPVVQPNNPGRDRFPNFPNLPNTPPRDNTPPQVQPRPRDNNPPSVQPRPGENNPGRDRHPNFPNFPGVQPVVQPRTDTTVNPPRTTPRDQFPNFPGVNPVVRPDRTPPSVNPNDRTPPTTTPRIDFPDLRPIVGPNNPDIRPAVRPNNPDIRPAVRPANPEFRPVVNPNDPNFRPIVKPNVQPSDQVRPNVPADQTRVPGQGQRPQSPLDMITRDLLPGRQPTVQPGYNPGDNYPQNQPQKPNTKSIISGIARDLLVGPQTVQPAGYYPDGTPYYPNPNSPGGYSPGGYYPNTPGYSPGGFQPGGSRPLTPKGILGEVVRDLIDPNAQYRPQPGYQPGYDPGYRPGYTPPGYYPPGGYRPNPNFQPRPLTVQSLVGEVVRDLINPNSGPGCNPSPYDYNPNSPYQPYQPQYQPQFRPGCNPPNDYQPGFNPAMYPQDLNPNRFPTGRLAPPGAIRNFIRQGLGDLRNNPRGLEGVINSLGSLMNDVKFNVDAERRELSLGMDFTKPYDRMSEKQGTPPNPEVRRVLSGLDSIQLNPDALALNWKGEQLLSLDQQQGPGKDFRVLLGGGTNRTTLNIQSDETHLRLSNIQGLEAVDPTGRKIRIHAVDLDSSDPAGPKGSITMDNPVAKPAGLPPNTPWPEQVALPIVLNGEQQKAAAEGIPSLIRSINSMRTAAINGDLASLTQNFNPQDLMKVMAMLKPQPQPNPLVPPTPQPGIRPDIPVPPQPGIRPEVQPVPQPEVRPEVQPQQTIPQQTEIVRPNLGNIDYLDVLPKVRVAPTVQPQADRTVTPQAVTPADRTITPPAITPPADRTITPPAVTPPLDRPQIPNPPGNTPLTPRDGAVPSIPGPRPGERSSDILRESGIKVTGPDKIGPDKLFSLVFADADQQGPLVKGFTAKLGDTRFRQDLDTVGSTLNRFDVDKQRKAITVGLDFAKVYDTFETDPSKKKPETRQFLTGLQSVTVTPDQIRLRLNGPSMLPMEGEGLKKADLWLGTNNGETTFDIQTTDKTLSLKNITGLQAEVKVLGKKLNVYEVNIDASSGTPVATVLIDNPFDKPPGVSDSLWQKTMTMPLELGKTPEEQAEVSQRLPQTLRSLNSMRQGALNGAMAERIGQLTKDDIIAMLKFK